MTNVEIMPHGHRFQNGRNALMVKVVYPDGVKIEPFGEVLTKIKNKEIDPSNSTEFILELGLNYLYGI
jgi:hypothetical protein